MLRAGGARVRRCRVLVLRTRRRIAVRGRTVAVAIALAHLITRGVCRTRGARLTCSPVTMRVKVRMEVFVAPAGVLRPISQLSCERRRVGWACFTTPLKVRVGCNEKPRRARAVRLITSGRVVARDSDRVGRAVLALR